MVSNIFPLIPHYSNLLLMLTHASPVIYPCIFSRNCYTWCVLYLMCLDTTGRSSSTVIVTLSYHNIWQVFILAWWQVSRWKAFSVWWSILDVSTTVKFCMQWSLGGNFWDLRWSQNIFFLIYRSNGLTESSTSIAAIGVVLVHPRDILTATD